MKDPRITNPPETLPVPKISRFRLALNKVWRKLSHDSDYKIHFVYLVPSDVTPLATMAIQGIAQRLQAWYRWQMNGKTFNLNTPVVDVWNSAHSQDWYSTNPASEDPRSWYWLNSLEDIYSFGGGWGQEFDDWIVWVDAPIGAGQYAGGTTAGGSGIAVLHQKDVHAALGIDPDWTYCREVGGAGHELGHTFGLPHPDGDPDFGRIIMGTGYTIYPDCILNQDEVDQLNANRFFSHRIKLPQPSGQCHFNDNRLPRPPRPRPQPHPRPHETIS
jgi:hypothetical protein